MDDRWLSVDEVAEYLGVSKDTVYAWVTGKGMPGYKVGRLRKAAMGVLTVTMRRIAGKDFSDTSSGFRAFSRPVLEFFADTYPAEYMESVEALFTTVRAGYDVVEVPVTMRNRELGAPSNRTWRHRPCSLLRSEIVASSTGVSPDSVIKVGLSVRKGYRRAAGQVCPRRWGYCMLWRGRSRE